MEHDAADLTERIREETTRYLVPRTAALTDVLRRLIQHPYPPEVAFIEFQVFAQDAGLARGFPLRAFFLDEDDTEYFEYDGDEAKYPCCVDPELLDDEPVVPEDVCEGWGRLVPDLDTDTIAAEAVVPWFYAGWMAAGGPDFPLPARIRIHDDAFAFDLEAGTWIDAGTGEVITPPWPCRR